MARALVALVPSESKKLISEAVCAMDVVKNAVANGMVVIHPSSTTLFIGRKLSGQELTDGRRVWVSGVVTQEGLYVDERSRDVGKAFTNAGKTRQPGQSPNSWVFRKGKLELGRQLGDILDEMGPDDVYIKGANCIDRNGNVGVLYASRAAPGGTIGLVHRTLKKKKFHTIFPVGLEKLIPISVRDAAAEAKRQEYTYVMGLPCGLYPCRGTSVTEVDAIRILTGATAVPIAAGGLNTAGGAITLIIKGEPKQVDEAVEWVKKVKGATVPQVTPVKH